MALSYWWTMMSTVAVSPGLRRGSLASTRMVMSNTFAAEALPVARLIRRLARLATVVTSPWNVTPG